MYRQRTNYASYKHSPVLFSSVVYVGFDFKYVLYFTKKRDACFFSLKSLKPNLHFSTINSSQPLHSRLLCVKMYNMDDQKGNPIYITAGSSRMEGTGVNRENMLYESNDRREVVQPDTDPRAINETIFSFSPG